VGNRGLVSIVFVAESTIGLKKISGSGLSVVIDKVLRFCQAPRVYLLRVFSERFVYGQGLAFWFRRWPEGRTGGHKSELLLLVLRSANGGRFLRRGRINRCNST